MKSTSSSRCRLTDAVLEPVLDLGRQPLGNGFLKPGYDDEYFYDLGCGFSEESNLLQILVQPAPEVMFNESYAFYSGTSVRMSQHFEAFAENIISNGYLSEDQFIVEIGSNDGIFLKNFKKRGITHLGVEPASGVANVAEHEGIDVLRSFFNVHTAHHIVENYGNANVVMAANVLCHIPDIRGLAEAIAFLLTPDGVLIFEDPYLGDVIRLGSYDQIYDEHVFLFSALAVENIFEKVGMELVDVQPQPTHGGSMRYTVARRGQRLKSATVNALITQEREQGLHRVDTFHAFAQRVTDSAKSLLETLEHLKSENLRVGAYGATSKSTTIYNFVKIDQSLISCIYDNSFSKIGKLSPGAHIPIVEESEFGKNPPDVTFLAAWNHEEEILDRNKKYSESGRRWLTHLPKARFI